MADVGGVPYLMPTVNQSKVRIIIYGRYHEVKSLLISYKLSIMYSYFQRYDLKQIVGLTGYNDAFVVGAGAGPAHVVGCNSEVGSS